MNGNLRFILCLELICVLFGSYSVTAVINPPVGIGIICDKRTCKDQGTPSKIGFYNVTLSWNRIDTQEVYQVMKYILALDQQPNVTSVTLIDSGRHDGYYQLLPANKPLIKWENRDYSEQQANTANIQDIDSMCTEEIEFRIGDADELYCTKRTSSNAAHKRTSNRLSSLVINLIKHLKWSHVIILHDNETQIQAVGVIDALSMAGTMTLVYNIDTITDLHGRLYSIYRKETRLERSMKFVTLCRYTCTKTIINIANSFDDRSPKGTTLLTQFSRWLTVLLDGNQIMKQTLCMAASRLDNFAVVVLPKPRTTTPQDFLRILETTLCFLYRFNATVRGDNTSYPESLISALTQKSRERDPDYVCRGYYINTLSWSKKGRLFHTIGTVNGDGVSVTSDIFPNTKYGYNKKEFIVSTLPYAPFVMKTVVNGKAEYSGLSIDLLHELSVNLNFTMIEPKDKKWGSYINKENRTFNGLIGQLQRKECDLVFTVISAQKERTYACDFSYPYFYQFTTVVLKRTDPRENKWQTLIDPFHWIVHVAIGIAMFLTTLIIYLLERYNPYYSYVEKQTGSVDTDRLNHLHNAFWYMYGALLAQGGVHLPNSFAGRTFVSCWWLFSLVLVGTYCGNLIAFLTVTKETIPFNTLREMTSMSNRYKWGTLGGSFWEVVFTTSNTSVFREIGDKMVEFNKSDPDIFHLDPQFHIQRVKEGGYAWIADKTYIERVIATDCDLVRIKEEVFPWLIAVGLIKDSPHTRIFDAAIMKIHESGLLELWKKKWWPRSNVCRNLDKITEAKPISLTDVQSAFYVCCIGIGISLTAFFCELLISYVRNRKFSKPRESIAMVDNSEQQCVKL